MFKQLQEGILLDKLPEDITNAIYKGKTSLKNNPSIPPSFEDSYLDKIMQNKFKEIKDELKKIGEIDDVSETDIPTVLNKLIIKAQKIESLNKEALEKLCYNYIVDLFDIPEDIVSIDFQLVEKVDIDTETINLDPIKDEIEYDDLNQLERLHDEIYKRRMLDVLSMGAGMCFSSNIKSYLDDIYDIEPKLVDLYRKIITLNDYLLFTKEDLDITDENNMQIGTVVVSLGNVNEKPLIKAQGVIFPVLLCESIRGFMELFSSHGLPKDKNEVNIVLNMADYLKAEPWDMRLGPSLWSILSESFNEMKPQVIPYLYKKISCLFPKNFTIFMREILSKTKKGKTLLGKLIEKSKEEFEYNKFSSKMDKMKMDKNLINDEYINENEL